MASCAWIALGEIVQGRGSRRFIGTCLVDLLLGDESRAQQRLEPLARILSEDKLFARPKHLNLGGLRAGALRAHLASGESDLRLERGHLGPSLRQLKFIRLRVDEQQRIAFFNRLVIGDHDSHDTSIDLRCHRGAIGKDPCIVSSGASIDLEYDGDRQYERRYDGDDGNDLAPGCDVLTHIVS